MSKCVVVILMRFFLLLGFLGSASGLLAASGRQRSRRNLQVQTEMQAHDESSSEIFGREESTQPSSDAGTRGSIPEPKKQSRSLPRVPSYMWKMYERVTRESSNKEHHCDNKIHMSVPKEEEAFYRGCGSKDVVFHLEENGDTPSYQTVQNAQLYVEFFFGENRKDKSYQRSPTARRPRTTDGLPAHDERSRFLELTLDFKDSSTQVEIMNISTYEETVVDVTSLLQQWAKIGGTKKTFTLHLRVPPEYDQWQKRLCRRVQWDASILVTWEEDRPCLPYAVTSNLNADHGKQVTEETRLSEKESVNKMGGRSRRSSPPEGKENRLCTLETYNIDFREIGWDSWVIAPSDFDAQRCRGGCSYPFPEHKEVTNHALVFSILKEMTNHTIGASCVPISYKPLQLLHYNIDNKIVLKKHENMVATACGCH